MKAAPEKAFPCSNDADKQYNWINKGMDLRDYFAAQIACGDAASGEDSWPSDARDQALLSRANFYYRLADAMLEARKK